MIFLRSKQAGLKLRIKIFASRYDPPSLPGEGLGRLTRWGILPHSPLPACHNRFKWTRINTALTPYLNRSADRPRSPTDRARCWLLPRISLQRRHTARVPHPGQVRRLTVRPAPGQSQVSPADPSWVASEATRHQAAAAHGGIIGTPDT